MEPVVIHCGHRGPEQRVEKKKKEKKTHTKVVLASGDKRQNNVKQNVWKCRIIMYGITAVQSKNESSLIRAIVFILKKNVSLTLFRFKAHTEYTAPLFWTGANQCFQKEIEIMP